MIQQERLVKVFLLYYFYLFFQLNFIKRLNQRAGAVEDANVDTDKGADVK